MPTDRQQIASSGAAETHAAAGAGRSVAVARGGLLNHATVLIAMGSNSKRQLPLPETIHDCIVGMRAVSSSPVALSPADDVVAAAAAAQAEPAVAEQQQMEPIIEDKLFKYPRIVTQYSLNGTSFVACGEDHSILVNSEGHVFSSGSNRQGKIGIGSKHKYTARRKGAIQITRTIHEEERKVVSVASRDNCTVFVRKDGKLYYSGLVPGGGTGRDSIQPSFSPVKFPSSKLKKHKAETVALGRGHMIVISKDGRLFGQGDNSRGQLGLGLRSSQEQPTQNTLRSIPFSKHDSISSVASSSGSIDNDHYPIQVDCGKRFTVVLSRSGRVYITGSNVFGLVPRSQELVPRSLYKFTAVPRSCFGNRKIVSIACGWRHVLMLDEDGNVWAAGKNSRQQIGHEIEQSYIQTPIRLGYTNVVKIFAGYYSSCIILPGNRVLTAGWNAWQGGQSEFTPISWPDPALHDDNKFSVQQVSLGESHAIILMKNELHTRGNLSTLNELRISSTFADMDVCCAD